VIEDDQAQQEIAKRMIVERGHYGVICNSLYLAYLWLDNLDELRKIESEYSHCESHKKTLPGDVDWDFVVIDLNFVFIDNSHKFKPAEFGYEVAYHCKKIEKPCCIHTSLDHHQANSMAAYRLCTIFDCAYFPDKYGDRAEGSWDRVFDYAEKFERPDIHGRLDVGFCYI